MRRELAIARGFANAVPGTYAYGRREALKRDRRACRICGFTLALNVHHVTPRAEGGTNDLDNVITLCPNHHAMVHAGKIKPDTLRAILTRPVRGPATEVPTLPGVA
jgi:5-methylcytosine-specific restriction endonuclease McrA